MEQIIYITYCCKSKAKIQENYRISPAELYTSFRIHTFINFCNFHNYSWAIFSDKYGLVFKEDKIGWYDKPPDNVTSLEYNNLLSSTMNRLQIYDTVFFYYCDESFHPLYRRLARDIGMYKKIKLLTDLEEIDATD